MSRITDRHRDGHLVLGTWINFGAPREVAALAAAGLDFVRLDSSKQPWSDDVIRAVAAECRTHGVSLWVRTKSDPTEIARHMRLGVDALTVPEVESAEQAKRIVDAAASPRRADFLVGCQVESRAGIANLESIVAVSGVDVIHGGRTDLAADLGTGLDQFDPQILAIEQSIAEAAMRAGKKVALMYPLDANGLGHVRRWMQRGVRMFVLDTDVAVLRAAFSGPVATLRAALS
jgi:4-hydroxy-2-oxoheptanedioate aldolase